MRVCSTRRGKGEEEGGRVGNEGGSFTSIHEPGETSHVFAGWTGGSGRGGTTKN
jgi:hypothetical protein